MQALDGNAIAGTLFEYFGTEMTTARGTCAHCGASAQVAEVRVYPKAPGIVARCANCANVVFVLASIRGTLHVNMSAFRLEHRQERPVRRG